MQDAPRPAAARPPAPARVCPLDGVPVALHARCWRCGTLCGPAHAEPVPSAKTLGACRSCAKAIGRAVEWLTGQSEPVLVDQDDDRAVLVGVGEAARRVRRTPGAIRRMIKAGKLPARTNDHDDERGKRYLIRVTDLDRLRDPA